MIVLDMEEFILYHGSNHIVEHPYLGGGKSYNDYGSGFYCTKILDLAREWSCTEGDGGFANQYRLDAKGLSVLHLNSKSYHILNWLAILLENRQFDVSEGLMSDAKDYILETFLPPYGSYDLITGYRADDSYFSFSRAFLAGTISLEQLCKAMNLGKLGEQIVLKSEKAFSQIEFVKAEPVDYNVYFARKKARDLAAAQEYRSMAAETKAVDAIYILDILRQQWKNDDTRLR